MLEEIDGYIQIGYKITYDITNQVENGYGESVKNGSMKLYTYSFYIYKPNEVDFDECFSVDGLEDGFKEALKYLKYMEDTK